ncbi:MAG: protein-disulfide reductase DsbD [Burkholderiaceae bacterium]|nr:protein-disulfide reductase DsbD [Burkholderiaceae bacterium]
MLLYRQEVVVASGWVRVLRSAALRMSGLLLLIMAMMMGALAHAQDDFLDPEKAFVFSAAMANPTEVHVHFKVAPEYYMYRERFEFSVAPAENQAVLGEAIYPPGTVTYDPTFEKDMEVYYQQVTVRLPLAAGSGLPLTLTVVSQGCADAGLCYPPMDSVITLTPVANGYAASGSGVVDSVPAPSDNVLATNSTTSIGSVLSMGDTGFAAYLAGAGWMEIVLLCFLLGMLLSFTPCVLPMVPILLAILAGDQGGKGKLSRWRGLTLAAAFVLGMSLVYTVLGVAAGLVGASMAVWLQTPWVLTLFAVLLALLALAMFDVFTLQAPTGMQSAMNNWLSKLPGGKYSGVFLMGMVSALIVGPCVAAPLAGVLLFISQTGDLTLGGTALFSMAWGEGLLLLAVGASSGALMPKAGPWMNGIKQLFGILLLATAWWMVNSVLPDSVMIMGWAVLALLSAVMMGAFAPIANDAGLGRLLNKTLGLLLALWAVLLVVGVSAGGRDVFQPLEAFTRPVPALTVGGVASAQPGQTSSVAAPTFSKVATVQELDSLLATTSQPVILDFYADWCVSCLEMEKFTFSDAGVAQRMSEFLLLQADVTKNTPADRELLKRFSLFGPPGIIFFDAQGKQRSDPRVVGFQNAAKFTQALDKAR